MGIYLNPGTNLFLEARAGKIYVDKSLFISSLNGGSWHSAEVCLYQPST